MTAFNRLAIPDLIEITPRKFGDERGFFSEVFKTSDFQAEGVAISWTQDNHSFSAPVGTVRGLHFQIPPFAQDKLVRVIRGAIFDVALDIRAGSPTYGDWVSCVLSDRLWNQLLIPAGFAHGFMTVLPDTEVIYKVSAPYSPESERTVLWNDPALAIAWPELDVEPTLSDKDREAPCFADLISPFAYKG